ncbi:hypothetical protein DMENIID0001_104180 [Sergentomyia squamirostris]
MMLCEVQVKLQEFRKILHNNGNLMQILVGYNNVDLSQLYGTHTQAQFNQMKSWFDDMITFSRELLSEVRNIIENFVDFQRDRPVHIPSFSEFEEVCVDFYQCLMDLCKQFTDVQNNQLAWIMFALSGYSDDRLPMWSMWWNEIQRIMVILIQCSLIYESQPPSIIRKDRIFSAKLRWLVGSKLDVNMIKNIRGTIQIVNENVVNNLRRGANQQTSGFLPITQRAEPYFEIGEHGEVTMELSKNILSMISRNPSRNVDKKIDEKYALLFRTDILWNNETVEICAISLPICLTTHMLQDEYSNGRIMWDYAFSRGNDQEPRVPEVVTWQELAPVLSRTWKSSIGCHLTEYHLRYLYDKLFDKHPDSQELPSLTISWIQFARNHMPGTDFTFWSWFYNAMRLIKKYFAEHWRENYVIGFIHKNNARMWLENQQPAGTFLFRFSESLLGRMSIDVILEEKDYNLRVSSCGPFSDFNNKTLNQFIGDFETLTTLYPGIPLNQAFPRESACKTPNPTHYRPVNTKHTVANDE